MGQNIKTIIKHESKKTDYLITTKHVKKISDGKQTVGSCSWMWKKRACVKT